MTKNELIKLLSELPGNPEVVLWNGFVEDYQHIDKEIIESKLVKHSKEFFQRFKPNFSKKELSAAVLNQEWEFPNEYLKPEEYTEWYGKYQKRVFILNGKPRNKATWDRLGGMEY